MKRPPRTLGLLLVLCACALAACGDRHEPVKPTVHAASLPR